MNTNETNNEINVTDVILFFIKNKKIIRRSTAFFFILSITYALLATKYYEATISLYPSTSETNSSLANIQNIASSFGLMGANNDAYYIPDVVNSRKIKTEVLLTKWKTEKFNKPVDLIKYWEIEEETKNENLREALEEIEDLISTSVDPESGLITISVLMPEKQLAADIADSIGIKIQKYIQFEQRIKSKEDRIFIENRLKETFKELTQTEEKLKIFREKNRILSESPELQLEYARLQRAVTIKQEVYITLQQQKELAIIEEQKNRPVINILDNAMKPEKKVKPKRILIVLLGTFLGFIMSTIFILTKNFILKNKTLLKDRV